MTIPQAIMEEAALLRNTVLWTSNASIEVIARALLAAEQRGAERERERREQQQREWNEAPVHGDIVGVSSFAIRNTKD